MHCIGIVGAGLSGLTTAYRLMKHNIRSTIFEASTRIGGRAWTETFPNGQIYEIGGQYIDSDHTDLIDLVHEVGLELMEFPTNPNLIDKYLVTDYDLPDLPLVTYHMADAFRDYQKIFPKISQDAHLAYPEKEFDPLNPYAIALDKINMVDYIDDICSILRPDLDGKKTKFAQILKIVYLVEYGLEPELQSSLNLIMLLGFGSIDKLRWFGSSDEKYVIKGGTQRLTDRLTEHLFASGLCDIKLSSPVSKIKWIPNGYQITANNVEYRYSHIVMTIPFPMYDRIDYTEACFSPLKLYIIKNYKMGRHTKCNIQFHDKVWHTMGDNGLIYVNHVDLPFQNTWDATVNEVDNCRILMNFSAGQYAASLTELPSFYDQLETIYPGSKDGIQNGHIMNWTQHEWTRGSYSIYTVGQYAGGDGILIADGTSLGVSPRGVVPFAGHEGLSEQNCHFAGEAVSVIWQGFLQGAVYSGNSVANVILNLLLF